MKSRKLLSALAAAGIAAHTVGVSGAMAHPSGHGHQVSQSHHDFDHKASRFKGPGDWGRPDIFGGPGRPDIGPPGHYGG